MTIGGLVDYAHTYIDEVDKAKKKETNIREATQDDIDKYM